MEGASSRLRRRVLTALGVCCMLGVALAGDAAPPQPDQEKRKLERVRQEMQRVQSILEKTRHEEKSVLGELQRMDLELTLHRQEIGILARQLTQCGAEMREAEQRLEESRSRLDASERDLAARMRAMYRRGAWDFERVLLTANHPAEVVSAYRLAARAALTDQNRIGLYRQRESQWREALGGLEEKRAELTQLRSEEIARRAELESLRTQRSQMLSSLRKDAADQEGTLTEMAETRQALERLVRALTEGGVVGPELKVGFEKYHGLLPWPVPGKILVGFGAQKNARFETLVPHPGIDLMVSDGEPIHAVHEGMVAFSDWFKGFGNLIVLEHGDGYMTVYAHAAERLVSTGDQVVAGQVIAKAGDTGSLDGPKLYFEIIRDGKPENPVGWLTRR
jgi:murein hydrolase activator